MCHLDFITKHCQIEHLNKMRDIQPGSLHIHLVFTAGTRLIIVALGIINLRCLKPMQKLRASNNVFNVIAKSRTLYISPFSTAAFSAELLLDLYLVVVYKAYLRYLTTFHDTLIVSPDSSVLFFCLPQQLPPPDFP